MPKASLGSEVLNKVEKEGAVILRKTPKGDNIEISVHSHDGRTIKRYTKKAKKL